MITFRGSVITMPRMTMYEQAFEVVSVERTETGVWSVAGRAYVDIEVGDVLGTSEADGTRGKVVAIVTYGRGIDLLSAGMTGMLTLEGDLSLAVDGRAQHAPGGSSSRKRQLVLFVLLAIPARSAV